MIMSVSAYNNNIALYTTFQLLQPLPQLSTRSINLNHRPVRHTIQQPQETRFVFM